MLGLTSTALGALALAAPLASAHVAFWHKSMYGFNVTGETFNYDNRPQAPLAAYTLDQWWFHGHLGYPPNDGDFFELPAGKSVNAEISCDKGATSWYNSSQGGNAGYGTNWPCPGQPSSQFHTTGVDDLAGCALAIVYESDVSKIKPEDFSIFSVNYQCVWTLNTPFQVPAAMPECPEGGCTCAWFWIHNADSGAEQMYMNGFKCKVTGATGTTAIGVPQVPRRCGADPSLNRAAATPSNCTVGPMQPMYWYQKEGNNEFEDTYHNPRYNALYGFADGAQDYIFTGAGNVSPAPAFIGGPAQSSSAAGSTTTSSAAAAASSSSSPAAAASSSKPAPAGAATASSSSSAAAAPGTTSSSSPAPGTTSSSSPAGAGGATSSPAPAGGAGGAASSSTPASTPSSSPAGSPAATSSATSVAAPAAGKPTASSSASSVAAPATDKPTATPVATSASASSAAPPAATTRKCKRRAAKRSPLERAHASHKRRHARLAHDAELY